MALGSIQVTQSKTLDDQQRLPMVLCVHFEYMISIKQTLNLLNQLS